jgi:hypothetical protein
MGDNTSTTPLLPSSLRQAYSPFSGQRLRQSSPGLSLFGVIGANPLVSLSIHAISMRCDRLVIHTFAVEAIALSMLFMMWLVGTAIATVSIFIRTLTRYADAY